MEPSEEKKLIASAKQGDEEAFSSLVAPYRAKLFHLCFSVVKDHEAAEDLTQEALISAYTHISQFKGKARIYTWLYRIALNQCISFLRKQKRLKEVPYIDELVSSKKKSLFAPSHDLDQDQMDPIIDEAVHTLSFKHRIVFEMYVQKGMAQKEIAATLNIPVGTVRSRLHTARKQIKAYIELGHG